MLMIRQYLGMGLECVWGGGVSNIEWSVVINTLKQWMRMKGHFLMWQVAFQS